MNPDLSPASRRPQKLQVRSWYLIGLFFLIAALLVLGEYFAFNLPTSGKADSSMNPEKTVQDGGYFRILSRHSVAESGSAHEL